MFSVVVELQVTETVGSSMVDKRRWLDAMWMVSLELLISIALLFIQVLELCDSIFFHDVSYFLE